MRIHEYYKAIPSDHPTNHWCLAMDVEGKRFSCEGKNQRGGIMPIGYSRLIVDNIEEMQQIYFYVVMLSRTRRLVVE